MKVLLPQGGEFVQEPRRRIYEVRKIALAAGRGNPVVAGKCGSGRGGGWRPILAKRRICRTRGRRHCLVDARDELIRGDEGDLREASVRSAPERRIDRAQVIEEFR